MRMPCRRLCSKCTCHVPPLTPTQSCAHPPQPTPPAPADFQERLRYYSLRKQLKQRAAAATADADACTFRPDTGNAVQVLALSSRAGNLLETEQVRRGCGAGSAWCCWLPCIALALVGLQAKPWGWALSPGAHRPPPSPTCRLQQERYERLGCEEAERQAARRAAKQAEVYGGLAFTPQLNPRSRALAPAGSGGVDGLAADAQRQRERLESLRREEEERRRAECTFQVRQGSSLAEARLAAYAAHAHAHPPAALPSAAAARHPQAAGEGVL